MIDEKCILEQTEQLKQSQFADERFVDGVAAVEVLIEFAPKVGEWIPCSERLPDDFGLYLTSYMDYTGYHVNLLVFDPKEHFDVDFWKEEIDAWMPLPPAYKEGD